jgi:hypothetical protein
MCVKHDVSLISDTVAPAGNQNGDVRKTCLRLLYNGRHMILSISPISYTVVQPIIKSVTYVHKACFRLLYSERHDE